MDVWHKFGNDLSICVTFKLATLAYEIILDLFVVGDDAIVNNNKLVIIRPIGKEDASN